MSKTSKFHQSAFAFLSVAVMAGSFTVLSATAEEAKKATPPDPSVLRICASEVEKPYSMRDGNGFENKIGKVLAEAMGKRARFVWTDKPAIYLVRDQLDKNNCDVVIGLDTGDERVLTSNPYYRAPYVFVVRSDSPLDITSWDSPDILKASKIGMSQDSPAQVMLEKLGLFNSNFNYMKSLVGFKSKRNQYIRVDPQRYVDDVASGKADFAVVFSPEVARYAKDRGNALKLVVVPDNATRSDGQHLPFHFDQSIAVRKDDKQLLAEVNAALEKAKPEIESILKEEGIPLDELAKTPEGRQG
ncbi:MxaJ, protein involved in methanol oxidation [Hyphomicrobium sulfonivorans]|uniref:MxaJ, protein involved in methanol oxidation n=1 Tax=Hyphomicrobium sulfonivorans TaxID=121290 RepID=A0A120CTU1_HYPSL|nr:methanol oxidation system protein MoxJ [Hyphomicrobium sulfonivorans]KWT65219.1 MxaJ, protein involved in methanol oxidation [Hyphomicrobium sulfonivorans]